MSAGETTGPDPEAPGGQRTNLVRIATRLIGSTAFNDQPRPLHISGTRAEHADLFERLEATDGAEAAADLFQDYMAQTFGIAPDFSGSPGADGRKRFRSSYLRLLKGWMFDSNNAEGAVLKGWVESRFGLMPTYHKEPLHRLSSPAWTAYVEEKLSSRFHNNNIHLQLDLLFEFCQWSVPRLFGPDKSPNGTHITLYRGVNGFDEHHVVSRPDKRLAILRLNNLVSFTDQRHIACQFGDYILEARVPLAKLLFFRDLLPRYPFQGEGEYLVVGGDYRVTVALL
jgi:NAD+---dinitrogen-reductase ADP-D-ribosyltransferase